jgi:hypothetical protein
MRYVFATSDAVIRSKLEAGSLLLVFPPEEQALAYRVICGIMQLLETSELEELAQMLRTEHNKQEEN